MMQFSDSNHFKFILLIAIFFFRQLPKMRGDYVFACVCMRVNLSAELAKYLIK